MQRLLQGDNRWRNVKIGNSSLTLAVAGCTLTSISMGTDYFGFWERPDELAKELRFTSGGLLYWDSVAEKLPITATRFTKVDIQRIDQALESPSEVAIIEVNFGVGKHWMVATQKVSGTNHYYVADPLNVDPKRTTKIYGGVTGFAILALKDPVPVITQPPVVPPVIIPDVEPTTKQEIDRAIEILQKISNKL